MADIEELLTDTPVRLAPAAAIRARGARRRTARRAAVAVVAVVAAGAMGLGVCGGLVLPDESGGADEGEWEGESDTAPRPEAGLGSTCGTWSGDLDLPLEMR
ncbi:hypothetical protein ABZ702_34315 [Streptomyces cyaneofuscatus]|uniref:hypothetical protein n=1 Tax=Streptomyces cyaneofuscatus TaxID=66883 RepID=UPI0033EEE205